MPQVYPSERENINKEELQTKWINKKIALQN